MILFFLSAFSIFCFVHVTIIRLVFSRIGKIAGLGAPVASIGGAGTFHGIFLTRIQGGLLAALVA